MGDEFQTIHRTSDPIEAEILADLLCQNGIDARVIGTRHGALIGVAQHILALRVEVPGHQVKDACELVDAYLSEHKAPESEPESEPEPEPVRDPRLRWLLAAGITPIFPGGGHFYARRPAAAFVVILGYLGAFTTLMTATHRDRYTAGVLLGAGIFLYDLIGSQMALRAFNRGLRASVKRQLAVALSVLATVAVGSRLVAPVIPDMPLRQQPAPIPLGEGEMPLPPLLDP